jgi:hypothetical protein
MKNYHKIALVIFTLAYSLLFWHEKFGINLLIFSLGIITYLFSQYQPAFNQTAVKITLAGTVISGIMVVVFNSTISKFAHLTSFWIMIGFIHQHQLKSIQHIIQYVILHHLKVPALFVHEVKAAETSGKSKLPIFYYARITGIPLILLAIFYILFYLANPKFAALSNQVWGRFFSMLGELFQHISFSRIFFTLSGLFIVTSIIYCSQPSYLNQWFNQQKDRLVRQRKIRRDRVFDSINALRNEYRAAIILIALVNLLLLVVNTIDISWIWINFTIPKGMVLKHFVHEGTYLLIASILLSIGIILYFFRNNLNFFPNNRLLKILAFIWMAQNIILSISVYLRNYHYINMHGLAYKRLGVIIFLILTIAGLVSMMIKIHQTKTSFYVVKTNLWACYTMMVVMSLINWDILIAKFNLSHWNKPGIDIGFYFTLSPKTIPLVLTQLDTIEAQLNACNQQGTNYTEFQSYQEFYRNLCNEKLAYIQQQQEYSIFSWNLADAQTLNALKQP